MCHKNSSLCGPHNLHVSPCSIATSIFSCIYLISSIIKYLFHSNVWTSFIISLIKNPYVSIQPRELVGLLELSCYAIIWMGTLQSSQPKIDCPQEIPDLDAAKYSPLPMFHIHFVYPSIVLSSLWYFFFSISFPLSSKYFSEQVWADLHHPKEEVFPWIKYHPIVQH